MVGGEPPIAEHGSDAGDTRLGIDRSPIDVSKPEDARWLLACVWPDTGRLERTAASISLAQDDLPTLIKGDANEVLPEVLADLPGEARAIVMTTWAFAYFSLEQRQRFAEILDDASNQRPIGWLSAEGSGVVDAFAEIPGGKGGSIACDLLGAILFDHGTRRAELLAMTHPHGRWIDWRTSKV